MVGASGAGFGTTAVNAKAASSKAAKKNARSPKKTATAAAAAELDGRRGAAAEVPFSPAPLAETDD